MNHLLRISSLLMAIHPRSDLTEIQMGGGGGGGGVLNMSDDIPFSALNTRRTNPNFEDIFLEIDIRKSKWLLFGGYNPCKDNISCFLKELGSTLDLYLPKHENILHLGDFNSECTEPSMKEFCDTYNVKNNLIN